MYVTIRHLDDPDIIVAVTTNYDWLDVWWVARRIVRYASAVTATKYYTSCDSQLMDIGLIAGQIKSPTPLLDEVLETLGLTAEFSEEPPEIDDYDLDEIFERTRL